MNLITTAQAAKKFNVTVNMIDVWLQRGKLKRHQEGEKWARVLVDADEVKNLVKSSKKKKPRPLIVKRNEASCNFCEALPIDRNLPISEITGERRWLCKPCWRTDEMTKQKSNGLKS